MSGILRLAALAGGNAPEPAFIWTTNLVFRFSASEGVFSDTDGTVPAVAGDPVAVWSNLGSGLDTTQPTLARRPVYRTGGLRGRPYLECDAAQEQYFENLAFTHIIGVNQLTPFSLLVVTDAVDMTAVRPIMTPTEHLANKGSVFFRPTADEQISFVKPQVRVGNVVNPQVLSTSAAGSGGRFKVRQFPGTVVLFDALQTTNLATAAVASMQFLRGFDVTVPTNRFFHGRIYEFLLYDAVVDLVPVETWLCQRYGISL